MRLTALLAFLLLPLPALAETPMTAAEFDAYVTGKTLTYSQFGTIFGTEEYLPGRKVRWAFTEDICQYGTWYEEAGNICFVYEYDPTPHCWRFWQEGDGLKALSVNDAPGSELSEVAQTDQPLSCAGPDVGV
ncbi:hypothetical protein [Tabrizicola sp.]|uniref:hypothetical protein n=1 Tax=Tabrizicola sp. TaxID=2005166 RepID=UPI00286CF155|nr:hypothetical protein [Tabrizicola sp.]